MKIIIYFRRILLHVLNPLIVGIGRAELPFTKREVKGRHYRKALKILEPGDLILTRKNGEPTNFLIPGFYTHAMIYTSEDTVVEATGLGVHASDTLDALMSKDYFVIVRPIFAEKYIRMLAALEASKISKKNFKYDYYFTPSNNAFYCAELIYYVYKLLLKSDMEFEMRKCLGVHTVAPQDYYNAENHFEILYDSREN